MSTVQSDLEREIINCAENRTSDNSGSSAGQGGNGVGWGLAELLEQAASQDVVLLKHGRPAGVLLSVSRYEQILAQVETLEDLAAAGQADGWQPFNRTT